MPDPERDTVGGADQPHASGPWTIPAAPAITIETPLSATLYAGNQPTTVVLLHSLALDRRIWGSVIDPLAARVSVLACDLPGHGRSFAVPESTVEGMADQVVSTMAAAGIDSAALVGMSLGGSVAQAVAIRHPERVRALALLDTTAWYGDDAPRTWASRAEKARQLGFSALAQFQLDRWFSDDFRQYRPDVCDATLDLFCATDLDGYVAACKAFGAMDLRPGVGSITCPTVVVVGEEDYATPPAAAHDIGRRVAGAVVHVVPKSKHLMAIERPATVLALTSDVLGV